MIHLNSSEKSTAAADSRRNNQRLNRRCTLLVNALCISVELGCALKLRPSSMPLPLQECLKEQPCLEA